MTDNVYGDALCVLVLAANHGSLVCSFVGVLVLAYRSAEIRRPGLGALPWARAGDFGCFELDFVFGDMDWTKLYQRQIKPSFVPRVKSGTDTSNFDAEFTSEPVVDSVVQGSALTDAKGAEFQGFTFQEKSNMG